MPPRKTPSRRRVPEPSRWDRWPHPFLDGVPVLAGLFGFVWSVVSPVAFGVEANPQIAWMSVGCMVIPAARLAQIILRQGGGP